MKNLLKILAGGLAFFMVAAVLEDREYFAGVLAGRSGRAVQTVSVEERQAVEAAVRLFLSIERHLYASGGDTRFADQLRASPAAFEELAAEVAYLKRNQRTQVMTLIRLDALETKALGEARVEFKTREYWVVKTLGLGTAVEVEPPHSSVVYARYLVGQKGGIWSVQGWEVEEAPTAPAAEPGRGG